MTIVSNSLVTFYSKIANLEDSVRVFETTERKDIISWNAVIAGNEQNGSYEIAIYLFQRLIGFELLLKPNRQTYLSVLSMISSTSTLNHGREVHAQMVRSGLDLDTSIANSLITMYGRCGKTDDVRLVFDGLRHRDVISWNSMLAGYEQNKQIDCCFNLLREMQLSGFKPDNHSLTIIASAASSSNPEKPTYKRLCREILMH
ncbi:Pentatricopeptide repeat-containing protein [Acorus calamus]|uniref:Pentatricopeptide repeat-containing protein n=1 Tax=Acorus calamus TaxID=4465 RepID=A0AAV9ES39_ACOCL|nr:Pentatricopeptide repeat-containing protein [Acorus calamus]